ncbi:MAG TPA: PAS domain-containing protein [Ferrovibrio sp.]|uniref:PAS domain-containing protein n=1 Tax=Ferrovibrio sp. TaxID=1917215 RepID=UPI002ED5424A
MPEGTTQPIFADEPILSEVARYWAAKRNGRLMPDRTDIDPLQLRPGIWPNLLITEPVPQSTAMRYRLVGSAHVQRYTYDFTGKTTADIMQGSYRDYMERIYGTVLQQALPVYSESLFRWDNADSILQQAFTRRLMLPLSRGTPDVAAMVLSVQVWPTAIPYEPRSISELSGSGGFSQGDFVPLDRDRFTPLS